MGGMLVRRGATGHCDVYEALGINTAGTGEDTRRALGGPAASTSRRAVTINRPVDELYRFWRNFENLPRFMQHSSRSSGSPTRCRTGARDGPGGTAVEWDAEIINEIPNKVIAWRSLEGSDVVSAGSVHFDEAGAGRGTRVRVHLQYSPPGGKVGAAVARLLGREPSADIREDLRRFKQLLEAGEIPTTDGQPRGRIDEGRSAGTARTTCGSTQVPDPKILNPRDAIVKVTLDRDLRLRPAPLRRLHPDDEARRHPRPRVHGRGRRGRARRSRS